MEKFNILIVDDVKANLISLESLLDDKFDNLKIYQTLSGNEALEVVLKNKIDIIISDVQMPNMDGFEMAEILKSNKKTKHIPIIFVSAIFSDAKYKRKGYNLGAIDYIAKPIDDVLFVARLKSRLEMIQLQNKTFSLLKEANKEKEKSRSIFDAQTSIVILTDGKTIVDANEQFFKELCFVDLKDFKSQYNCICDLFVSQVGERYLLDKVDGKNWLDYIKLHNNGFHEVNIQIHNENKIYKVQTSKTIYDGDKLLNVVLFTDITDLKKTTQILHEQSKLAAMGEMMGMITHQWRQPLTSISAALSLVKVKQAMHMASEEDISNTFNKIDNTVQFMDKVIDDFSQFFKKTNDEVFISIEKLVSKAAGIMEASFINSNVKLNFKYIDIEPSFELSTLGSKFDQVMLNIYKNSLDIFIENKTKDATIDITSTKVGDNIIIEVCDNAGGIPEDILHKVFDSHFSTKGLNGTGIGLDMSKQIVEEHMGGNIEAYNKNAGACFKISIPIN
jgi:signal transduction histidine kinase/DNA-binding response OmpR family regulator